MIPDSEVAHIIDAIATQLGVAAEQIFGMFVGAQPIIGVINLVSLVVAVAVAYMAWKVSRRAIAEVLTNDGDIILLSAWIAAILFFATLAVFDAVIEPSILKITCPEYSAMKEIISLMKP